jgi:hypothetical protein
MNFRRGKAADYSMPNVSDKVVRILLGRYPLEDMPETKKTTFNLRFGPQKEGIVKTFGWNELVQLPPSVVVIHLEGKAHDTKNTTEEKTWFDINVGL